MVDVSVVSMIFVPSSRLINVQEASLYCFSRFKVTDMTEQLSVITGLYPSLHTLIAHTGTNDVWQSIPGNKSKSKLESTIKFR